MTKIPSVEERVEEIVNKIAKGTDSDRTFGTGETLNPLSKRIITQALTADRTALLTELRDSGLLEKKEYSDEGDHQAMKYRNHNELGHNTLARAIKAHLDELINSTK